MVYINKKSTKVRPKTSMAVAMIKQAIKDLHHGNLTQIKYHVDAICWLGSKSGTKWFDAVNIDQASVLPKLRWSAYAENILSDDAVILSDDQHRMLIETLEYFKTKSEEA
tara:strand:+ start:265 stop:594 length:330 start_codon:yes stop_codon:yes gene_type:complete